MPALLQHSHPALRLLLSGVVLAALWWSHYGTADDEAWHVLTGDVAAHVGSWHVWSDLMLRSVRTLGLV